ncbi:PREDICTED: IgGFc-binding protein-like [Amphimedon queenslandica]|uniref:EGF-like domain-containing protein n=1 Tax=Amphimedon queenslandica TaxID=400682 RepID=A0AAN0IXU3_AMPQE|nr:PREDICTED: IgGFc-binding protein-like [Amphimedon queenslandica]|eukprot:XP_019849594.1 PREDICTED: IgGFc-binding protein-like [Amphimedon queenslandica]
MPKVHGHHDLALKCNITSSLKNLCSNYSIEDNAWSTAGNTHIVGILPMRASPFISLVITTSETETVNFTVSSLSQRIANGSVTSGTPTHISDSILISYAVSNESDRYKGILVSTGTDKTLSVTVVMMDSFNSAGVYVNYPISVCTVNNHSYVYYAVSIGTTETTSFSSLLIVSGNNNTNITITPTVTVTIPPNLTQSGHQTVLNAGQSITIQLHYLETLLLKPVVALADLTGTKVESSKPLSVYSGHTCGVIPPDRDDCDFVGEQLPPVVSWGKELLVQSFYNRQSGYILKIIGSQSNTNIDITCADGSNYFLSLQEGGVLNQTVSQTSCYINSTSPILVAQFVLGYFRYMYEPGDSAMTIIPPLHQYGNNVTSFSLISLLGAPVSVNLVVLAADESSQIQLNGTVLPSLTSSSWKRYNSSVGGSYVFNSTIIEDIDFGGNYIVEIRVWSNNSNDKILAMVYGLGRLFGYSYTGTLNQSPIEAYEGEYCQDLNSIVPNTPPVIEASDTFMITVGEKALYTLHITDPGDTISVTIDGEFPYTLDQNGSIWTLNVTLSSFVEFSFSVIASDSFNATSVITPQVRICGCPADRGNCTFEGVQNASSNPLILICNCIEAYKGDYCEDDFDGCTEVSCFNDATCTDVPAPGTGATCPPCPSGYTGDGLICDDIDECDSSSTSNCSHFCNNTIGSYHCTCMPGYELHSDGRSCNEIDECERLLDNCQQECMNTDGSFSCSCFDGFLLQDDGRSCKNDPSRECLDDNECEQFCVYDNYTETENCSCQSGYNLSSNMENCTDIDECSATNPCTQICNNAIGSFGCNCLDGFQLQSDGFTCTDIDECLVLSSCSEPRIRCVNSPGSFDCFCPLGTEFQDGSCTVILQPVRSSSSESFHMSSLPKNPSLSYSFSFFSSTTPSPSSIPTVPANSGVVVVLNGTNASTFDVESFKNVTAEALNEYCSSNNCTSAFLQNRKRSATNSIIEPDDIVITETTETSNGLKVTFYVKGKSGTPVDASAVVAAIKAADSRYVNAGFTIASLTLLNPPSTTIVVTPTASATPTDDGLSAGQIAGITIGVVIGTLLMIMIIISVACLICYRKRSNKVINRENNSDFTVENQYQETIPPTPAGSVRSIKLKLAQDFDSSDEDESESEDDLKSIIMNERVNLGGQVESFGVMPEESKETFL